MKKAVAAAAALAAAAVVLSPTAHADSVDQYMSDMTDYGFNVNGQNGLVALAMGLGVCVDLFNGSTMRAVAESATGVDGLDARGAANLVRVAVVNLCPAAANGGAA